MYHDELAEVVAEIDSNETEHVGENPGDLPKGQPFGVMQRSGAVGTEQSAVDGEEPNRLVALLSRLVVN